MHSYYSDAAVALVEDFLAVKDKYGYLNYRKTTRLFIAFLLEGNDPLEGFNALRNSNLCNSDLFDVLNGTHIITKAPSKVEAVAPPEKYTRGPRILSNTPMGYVSLYDSLRSKDFEIVRSRYGDEISDFLKNVVVSGTFAIYDRVEVCTNSPKYQDQLRAYKKYESLRERYHKDMFSFKICNFIISAKDVEEKATKLAEEIKVKSARLERLQALLKVRGDL